MHKACAVLLAALSSTICLSAQSNPGSTTIGPRWNVNNAYLPQYDWLYSRAISPEARYQLLPLYQEADRLLQELSFIRPGLANDVASGVGSPLASEAPSTAEESAAGAGQYGARYRCIDAYSSSLNPTDTTNVDRTKDIVTRLDEIDKQIYDLRQKYGIETISPTPKSPWSVLFQRTKLLTPDEVKKLLVPAAKEAAKPAEPPKLQTFDSWMKARNACKSADPPRRSGCLQSGTSMQKLSCLDAANAALAACMDAVPPISK